MKSKLWKIEKKGSIYWKNKWWGFLKKGRMRGWWGGIISEINIFTIMKLHTNFH